jgi:hypothetical protein
LFGFGLPAQTLCWLEINDWFLSARACDKITISSADTAPSPLKEETSAHQKSTVIAR